MSVNINSIQQRLSDGDKILLVSYALDACLDIKMLAEIISLLIIVLITDQQQKGQIGQSSLSTILNQNAFLFKKFCSICLTGTITPLFLIISLANYQILNTWKIGPESVPSVDSLVNYKTGD